MAARWRAASASARALVRFSLSSDLRTFSAVGVTPALGFGTGAILLGGGMGDGVVGVTGVAIDISAGSGDAMLATAG